METALPSERGATRDGTQTPLRAALSTFLFALGTALLAALIIYLVFAGGIRRGMDHVLSYGPESEQNAIAIALSEMVYGLDGYVGYASVFNSLVKFINRGAESPNDPKIIPNLSNGDLINEAITEARSLGPQAPGSVADRGVMTMVYDDVGIIDFIKLAFWLFGFKIQSLYCLYFAILCLSTAAFLAQFWRRPLAQVLLLCSLSALYFEFQTEIFNRDMPSFWGMRHGSTLALLPMWHLVLLLMYRARLSAAALILALVQVAILVLAVKIRGSAAWTLVFMVGVAILFGFREWRQLLLPDRSVRRFAGLSAKWPLLVVLGGWLANSVYTDAKLHPAYFTDDILPYHSAWHSAFLGLDSSPTLWAYKVSAWIKRPDSVPYTDRGAYDAAISYLQYRRFLGSEDQYVSPWTHTYKMRLHDRIIRRVFFEIIESHPASTVGLYLYWKPRQILITFGRLLSPTPIEVWLLMPLATLVLAAAVVATRSVSTAEIRMILWLALAALAFAALPNLWAYADFHTMADLVVSSFLFATFALWAGWALLLIQLRNRFENGQTRNRRSIVST